MFSASVIVGHCRLFFAKAAWRRLFLCALPAMAGWTPIAAAQPALDGYVVAQKACPATPKIRASDNPGGVRLEPGRAYRLLAENKAGGTHYLVLAPGASPEKRWIEKNCGERVASVRDLPVAPAEGESEAPEAQAATPKPRAAGRDGEARPRGRAEFVIALSWQAAFCEGQPGKPECRSQTDRRFDASNFALHGLWPQPRGRDFCGVPEEMRALDRSGDWMRLPAPEISDATRRALETEMPGVQSGLDRHEWTRHGTCYGSDAEDYFSDALAVLGAVNASAVRKLFAGGVGRPLTGAAIRAAFDESFGAGAGERVRVSCRRDGGRQIISELTVGLVGDIAPGADISRLIRAAPETDGGCEEGVVDAVGRQ